MPKPYNPNDHYFRKAKKEGFRARSAFKLSEILQKHKVIERGDTVVDLGAAPGSFLQEIARNVGEKGKAIGFDLQEIEKFREPHIYTFVADIFDETKIAECLKTLGIRKCNVITADLAPKTTGIKDIDQARSVELNEGVLEIAKTFLKKNGSIITKIFRGGDFDSFLLEIKKHFEKVSCHKPKACRDRSREIYLICQKFLVE